MLIIININRSKKYILPDFKLNFDWKLEVHNLVALLTHSEFRMKMTIWHVQLSNSFWSLVVYCDQLSGAQQNLTFCFKFSNSYVKKISNSTCCLSPWVMKVIRTSCALLIWVGIPYPTSRCRYVNVSIDGCPLRPSVSALDEYHIPRVITCHFREPCSLIKIYFIYNTTNHNWLCDCHFCHSNRERPFFLFSDEFGFKLFGIQITTVSTLNLTNKLWIFQAIQTDHFR